MSDWLNKLNGEALALSTFQVRILFRIGGHRPPLRSHRLRRLHGCGKLPNEAMRWARGVARPSPAAGFSTVPVRAAFPAIDWRRDAARTRRRGRLRYVKLPNEAIFEIRGPNHPKSERSPKPEYRALPSTPPRFLPNEPMRSARRFKVSSSRFKVIGKLPNEAIRFGMHASVDFYTALCGADGDSALPFLPNEAMRSARRFKVRSSTFKVYETKPTGICVDWCPFVVHPKITKRSHALGAPVQSFGFKVQSFSKITKRSHSIPHPCPLPSDGRRGRVGRDGKLPNEAMRSARRFKVRSSTFKVCETNPFRPSLPSPRRGKPNSTITKRTQYETLYQFIQTT